jgi:hypothetical protein
MRITRSAIESASCWSWGHQRCRGTELALKLLQLNLQILAELAIERTQGLVQQETFRLDYRHARCRSCTDLVHMERRATQGTNGARKQYIWATPTLFEPPQ